MLKNKLLILLAVLAISSNATADLTTGLIAYYPFNGNANDVSGNGYNGTVNGATLTTDRLGNANAAYSFDGSNYIDINIPTINTATDSKVTVSFWMNWDGHGNAYVMPFGFDYYCLDISYGKFGFNIGSNILLGMDNNNLINRWVLVTAVFNNGSVISNSIYVDGTKSTLTQYPGAVDTRFVKINAHISGWPTNSNWYFSGKLDDVRVYNRALTDAEVQELYQGFAKPTAVTNAPSVITSSSARFSGTVTPNGATTTASFDYGLTTSYGQIVTASPASIAATAAATAVSANVTGLNPVTTYHYRVKAINSAGTTNGLNQTFTTTAPSGSIKLTNGVALTDQTFSSGEWKYYYLTVPADSDNLKFTTTGTGDVEIYAQVNALPTIDNFACNSESATSNETCTPPTTTAGTWWLAVFGYDPSTVSVTGSFNQPQTIGTISLNPVAPLIAGRTATASATATSGLPVTFTSATTAVCSTSGSNGTTINGLTVGTCTLKANQAGNATYAAAPEKSENFNVEQLRQTIGTITFNPTSIVVGGTTTASATATSGLAVTFTVTTPDICSVNGAVIQSLHAGTCSVTANQPGDVTYQAAPAVSKTIVISKASQTLTLTCDPLSIAVGTTANCTATASSNLTPTVTAAPTTVCSINGGSTSSPSVTGIAIGNCTVTAKQTGNSDYLAATAATASIAVTKADQTISLNCTPTQINVGDTATCTASATSGLTVNLSPLDTSICTLAGNTVTGLKIGTCSIKAKQMGNANYNPAPSVTKYIAVGNPPPPVNGVCGSANGTTVATAPTTNLCITGTASAVNSGSTSSPTGYWTWSCAGSNGGTTANCSANLLTVVNAWLYPPTPTIIVEKPFILNVYANSNSLTLGSYDFLIKYESSKLIINYTQSAADCNREAVCSGTDGWSNYSVTNSPSSVVENGITYGTIRVRGLDATGTGPGSSLNLLKVYFKTQATPGTTAVNLTINELLSIQNNSIGAQNSAGGSSIIKISPGLCGDADGNNSVNIVDALAIARKVVGMPPPPTVNTLLADVNVNKDGVSIVDAMHIARYSVGLLTPPEVCAIGQPL